MLLSRLPKPLRRHDLVSRTMVVHSGKPNKPLEALEAPNPHQMNRVRGFTLDGQPVVVAQRPGKGGMDFNKLLGGKVFAVAADAVSPVMEKDAQGKPTKTQKTEDGVPLYSCSGFYSWSTREYPALSMFYAFSMLIEQGSKALLLSEDQLMAREVLELESPLDLELLESALVQALGDERNLVRQHDEAINRRRKRAIESAKADAEDQGETYTGVDYAELATSIKDGNPFVLCAWQSAGDKSSAVLLREHFVGDDERPRSEYFNAEQAVLLFRQSPEWARLERALEQGPVRFAFAQGNLMRTSPSFRRACEEVLAPGSTKVYGDAVYMRGAASGWTRALAKLMFSTHPSFPATDYDSLHYVAALRQAEVGLDKEGDSGRWSVPKAIHYDLAGWLLS